MPPTVARSGAKSVRLVHGWLDGELLERGLTRQELARRADLCSMTVYRAALGRAVARATMRRIVEALADSAPVAQVVA